MYKAREKKTKWLNANGWCQSHTGRLDVGRVYREAVKVKAGGRE